MQRRTRTSSANLTVSPNTQLGKKMPNHHSTDLREKLRSLVNSNVGRVREDWRYNSAVQHQRM